MKVTRLVNFVGHRFTKARETLSTIDYERELKWLADALISRYTRSTCEFTQPGRSGDADRRALLARSPDHNALIGFGRPASPCSARDENGLRGNKRHIRRGAVSGASH
jgi:hypothetical protein